MNPASEGIRSAVQSSKLLIRQFQIHPPNYRTPTKNSFAQRPGVSTFPRRFVRPLTSRLAPVERQTHGYDSQGNEQHRHKPFAYLLRLLSRCAVHFICPQQVPHLYLARVVDVVVGGRRRHCVSIRVGNGDYERHISIRNLW